MINSTRRSLGLSLTAFDASANMAINPPSPLLSARSTNATYLMDTITVMVQKNIDIRP